MNCGPIYIVTMLALVFFSSGAWGAEEERVGFGGEVEAGVVSTKGNSDTKTVNSRLRITHTGIKWNHEASASFLYASDKGKSTAQRLVAGEKSSYALAGRSYLYAAFRYEDDRFSGFKFRSIESAGYGYTFLRNGVNLAAEAGPGARQSKSNDGVRSNDLIFRVWSRLGWKISSSAGFATELTVTAGRQGTVTESETSVKSRIIGDLAMKLSYELRNNSRAPAGKRHTDTITSATLVYDF